MNEQNPAKENPAVRVVAQKILNVVMETTIKSGFIYDADAQSKLTELFITIINRETATPELLEVIKTSLKSILDIRDIIEDAGQADGAMGYMQLDAAMVACVTLSDVLKAALARYEGGTK